MHESYIFDRMGTLKKNFLMVVGVSVYQLLQFFGVNIFYLALVLFPLLFSSIVKKGTHACTIPQFCLH